MSYVTVNAINEEARLNALRDLRLLDTAPSESFDRLTRLASRLLEAPVSTISLTDRDRQWFKSKVGVDITEIPRAQAPCSYAIQGDDVFVVPDLNADPRFVDSPLAQAGIRFYAGAPLFTRAGHGLGTLCVVDARVREIDDEQRKVLRDLAGMVMSQIELQNMIGRVDATSGMPNQHQMLEDLEALSHACPHKAFECVLVDLVSSQLSSQAQRVMGVDYSEAVVRGAIQLLRKVLPGEAKLYHVGVTRLAFLLEGDAPEDRDAVVQAMTAALAEPIACNGVPVNTSPAIGTYTFVAGALKARDVLRRSISALEDARTADGSVAHYSRDEDERNARRFRLLSDFKAALASEDQLALAFQPRVDLASGQCVGAEALLRWRHPELGPVQPGEFIPTIEQTALARPMTEWVVAAALGQLRQWHAEGIEIAVSVNVSAHNLIEPDFARRVIEAMRRSGVGSGFLELEFTESVMARDSLRAVEQLQLLRAEGITIAIDDFGTGYSNLSYLQKLPGSVLKVDRSFVAGLERSERDRTLVRTIIAMSHDLGYRVVAEGIETEAAREFLAAWRCDEGQGYLLARPMQPAAFAEWFRGRGDVAPVRRAS